MQSASEQVIPAGMVAYGPGHPDYPNRPRDWDGVAVKYRSGSEYEVDHVAWAWKDGLTRPMDVIAYTPSPAPMVEQAGELKPCPFCGSTHTYVVPERGRGPKFVAECGNCYARIVEPSEIHAIAAWNTRPAPAETEGDWPSDGTCRKCGACPRSPTTGLCATCEDEASTPPADAGMLREALGPLMRQLSSAETDPLPFDEPLTDDDAVGVSLGDLRAIRAALNSQAHQIREGDHG